MKRLLAVVALWMVLAGPAVAEEQVTGAAKARGPETLAIAGARIRLSGVTAPAETARCASDAGAAPCTEAATAALEAFAAPGPVTCVKERRLGHGYFLGHCRTSDGTDPAEALLQQGLLAPAAGDLPERYRNAVAQAQAAKRGVWGG
jgi:endonuclease YncB( thermonuclease family)